MKDGAIMCLSLIHIFHGELSGYLVLTGYAEAFAVIVTMRENFT